MSELKPSHHPTTENIHRQQGCLTSMGILCNACCVFFEVKPLEKPAGAPCRHLNCGKGCEIHNQAQQPAICREYHCSRELAILNNPLIVDQRVRQLALERVEGLLKTSFEQGTITEDEYQKQLRHWEKQRAAVYDPSGYEEE